MGIFIASLCATLLLATMPTANTNRAKASNQTKALSLGQKTLESVRGLGYPNLTPQQLQANGMIDSTTPVATNTFSFTNVDNSAFDAPSIVLPQGEGRMTVEQLDIDLRRVIVELRWMDRGSQKVLRLGTTVANL